MVKRSVLEDDINSLVSDLKNNDYEIPSIKDTMRPVLRTLTPFYVLLAFGGLFSWVYHGPHELWSASFILIAVVLGAPLITFVVFGFMYYPNMLLLCISHDVKEKSFLCGRWFCLMKKVSFIVRVFCFVVSIPFLLMINWGFVVPLVSYFFMVFVAAVIIAVSMGRYLTPELINIAINIRNMFRTV